MKKVFLILILILTAGLSYSQIDTSVWGFRQDNVIGKYTHIYNKTAFMGIGANQFLVPIYLVNDGSIDTSIWQFYFNTVNGKYDYVSNKIEWLGLPAYSVKANLLEPVNAIGGSSFNTDSLWKYLTGEVAFLDSINTFSKLNIFSEIRVNKAFIDTLFSHYIDSLKSSYWYNGSGDVVAYIDVTKDTIAFFTVLKFGAGYGGTLINSDSVSAPKFVTDSIGSNSPLHILSDSIIVNNLYADTTKTAVLIMNGTEFVIGTFVGGVMYDRWIVENAGHLIPATDKGFNFGSADYMVNRSWTDSVEATTITTTNLKTANVIGTTAWRDTNSFDNQAESDTVTVSGASASDLYWVQTMGQTVNTADYCVVEPTATGFIVRRSGSGTANLKYSWMRIK